MGCCGSKTNVNRPNVDKKGNYYDKYAFLTPKQLKRKKELEEANNPPPEEQN